MMGFGFLGAVLVIALIVYLIGWRPQGNQSIFRNQDTQQSPIDILKARYARGEISKVEFEQMQEDLR